MLPGYELEGLIRLDPVAYRRYLGVMSSYQHLPVLPVDSLGFYIINTGHPNGPGEHWTCLYFNGDGSCTYCDSYGLWPHSRLYSRLTGLYTVLYNRLQFQGPFSLLLFSSVHQLLTINGGVRPRISCYDVSTGSTDLRLTVRGISHLPGGNFRRHIVVIRKGAKTLFLSWDHWEILCETGPSVMQAKPLLQITWATE